MRPNLAGLIDQAGRQWGLGIEGGQGVGVDIETGRRPPPRMARFFLTRKERRCLGQPSPEQLLRLWTVKEALFKADPLNHRRVLADYALDDPLADAGCARVRQKPGNIF